jgi:glycosyltransferase involved in cell wall biosynthesis
MLYPKTRIPGHILCLSPSPGDAFPTMIGHVPSEYNIKFSTLYYDEKTGKINGNDPNEVVYNFCRNEKVDVVMTHPQPFQEMICSQEWIKTLSKTSIAVCFIWYDAIVYPHLVNEMSKYAYNIILDDMHFKTEHNKDKTIHLWTPFALEIKKPENDRDINVSFLGSVDCPQRYKGLEYLYSKNIPVFHVGSTPWNKVHHNNWINFMSRTKISINFSNTRFFQDGSSQMKGRVFESMMCGAMLIESENNQTPTFFEPGKDMVFYSTHEDLEEKIRYYLENERERIRIATNGLYKCITKYNIENWWRRVLQSLLSRNKKRILI